MARLGGHRHGGPGARAVARYRLTRAHELKEGHTFPGQSRGRPLPPRWLQRLPGTSRRERVPTLSFLPGGERGLSGPSGPGHMANRGGMSG